MITQEELKRILHYDPLTGEWTWLNPPNHNTRLVGKRAGNRRSDGYLRIRIDYNLYYASHLANLYMTGKLPAEEMDHKDRDPSNDRWDNLREATSSQNKWNRQSKSYLGITGVYICSSGYQVQVGGVYYGIYETLEDAILVRDHFAAEAAGEFANLNTDE